VSILRGKDDEVAFEILRNEPVEEADAHGVIDRGAHWATFRVGG
jgi:hypothetical protein